MPIYSAINEDDKPQSTTYKGPQGFLTTFVHVIGSFSQDLRGPLKNCSKKGCLPTEKEDFGLFLLTQLSRTHLAEQTLTNH